jgi:hypothetical protein
MGTASPTTKRAVSPAFISDRLIARSFYPRMPSDTVAGHSMNALGSMLLRSNEDARGT